MFENLSDRLSRTTAALKGRGRLTEDNIRDTLRAVRMALLEADVALPVVRDFVARVKERAVGAEVARSLTPGQALIKIIHDELVRTLGEAEASLDLATQPPAVILLAGLQGAGKTTTMRMILDIVRPAVSLGGVETTICAPAVTSHAKMSAEERRCVGVTDALLRLSVGIEHIDDLFGDFDQALKQSTA